VPSGQGKSRISFSVAAVALKTGMFTKVQMLFLNKSLMKRDKDDFADITTLLDLED